MTARYLAWVRELPCKVCGNVPSEAHHIRGVGHLGGVGMKATDLAAMPLCPRHHRALHDLTLGKEALARQWEWAYKTLRLASCRGLVRPLSDAEEQTLADLQGEGYETLWRALSGFVGEPSE